MKLAILTCGILPLPAVQGGAVENLIDFYLEYNDREKLHDITVYSPRHPKAVVAPALCSDVNHYVFINVTSFWARTRRWLYGYFHKGEYYNYFIEYYFERIYDDLQKRDFDFIILENCPGYAYKLSQRGRRNLILHLHNELLHSESRYHDVIFNGLTKILTVSDYIKGRVSTIQPSSNKIQTVYNGIDLTKFSPKEIASVNRKTFGFKDEEFVIVYSGRINKDKGVSELTDAMLRLKDYPMIKLMILGSTFFNDADIKDDFVSRLRSKSEEIRDRIVFTGFIPYNQVPDYLHLANIAVLPSMWDEPFGLTIVEALAVGLPLITTRSGGIPEICEGVAMIVERDDIVNNLVSAILDLYEHPEKRRQMAAASLERAKLFGKETFAENYFTAIAED